MEELDMIDIEEILYDGTMEEIKNILKKYKISFWYSELNFEFSSGKLLQISRGYNSNKKPNCALYFGNTYEYGN